MKEEIVSWLNSNRDFTEGFVLFNKYSKNRNLKKLMAGRPKFTKKLAWELAKIAGVSLSDFQQGTVKAVKPETGNKTLESGGGQHSDGNELPKNVRRLMHVYNDVYKLRSSLHKQMRNLPENNSEEVVKKRKDLSDRIKVCSDRLDVLWKAREEWEKDKVIPNNSLFEEKTLISKVEDVVKRFINSEDKFDLLKRKKNLESSLAKDRNMLVYQVKTRQDKESPMPAGPKREKIEKRVEEKEKELNEINKALGNG